MAHHPHKLTYASDRDSKFKRVCITAIEFASGRRKIEHLYNEIQATELQPNEIWGFALSLLSVSIVFDKNQLAKVPAEGPIVLIANHPFGVLDGLILGHLTSLVRPNFVVPVMDVLALQDARLAKHLLPIDFRETKESIKINLNTRSQIIQRLDQGEALAIFPAGGVSTSPRGWGKADDLEWKRFVIKVIRRTRATVIPIFFHGQNSRIFQLISQVSQTLRLSMLLHEMRNKMGKEIRISIGNPIEYETIAHIRDRQALLDHLRQLTYDLSQFK